jgi:peptidoglycan/LPS O-acetylase OafA/YrhL
MRYIGGRTYTPNFVDTIPAGLHHSLNLGVLAGNFAFLETLWVPIVGTNSPLWSLPLEFWYYVIFPCFVVGFFGRKRPSVRLLALAVATLAAFVIAPKALPLFGVWLLGAGCAVLPARKLSWTVPVMTWILALCALAYGKSDHGGLRSDYLIGVTAAGVVYFASMSRFPGLPSYYTVASQYLSRISYTMYLAHFPAVVLLTAWWLDGQQMQPTIGNAPIGVAAVAIVTAYCCLVWCLGEKHTDRLRRLVGKRWGADRAVAPTAQPNATDTAETPG